MRVFTERVGQSGQLTGYLADRSAAMPTAHVRSAVLVLPGGGYEYCSDREAEPVALAYLGHGFDAFLLRYTAGPDVPWRASFADAVAALEWVREHAGELDVHPDRVAVVGFSAGGHLAACLGTLAGVRPAALVLGYPGVRGWTGLTPGKQLPDPVAAVDGSTPPAFLFHTVPDEVVPVGDSLAWLSALATSGVPFEAHLYPSGPHGISLATALTASGVAANDDAVVAGWLPDSVRFLRGRFGDVD